MRSVMVTKFVPSPANSGGKLRSLAVLRQLLSLGEVTLCCFEDATGDVRELERTGVEVRTVPWRPTAPNVLAGIAATHSGSAGRFWDRRLADVVAEATGNRPTDLLQVEYSQLAPYLKVGQAGYRVLDFHNIESSLARSYSRSSRSVRAALARVEAVLLKRLERRATGWADLVVVVSQEDRDRLPGRAREVLVCPNGWDTSEPLMAAHEPVVVFVALLGWKPNVDAARWLAREIWPLVIEEVPEARLDLVGRDPAPEVQSLASEHIRVTGTVPDVRPYLQSSQVALAPLRSGGGTRLKVLEALDAGRPVVSTSTGIDGLNDLIGKGVVVADDARGFADEVIKLLRDPERGVQLGLMGSRAVRDKYSWDTVLAPWRGWVCGLGK